MRDSGTTKQLKRRKDLVDRLAQLSPKTRAVFAASIAERLLSAAKEHLLAWRTAAWETYRSALDKVWDSLHGAVQSNREYASLRDECIRQLPNEELDHDWHGGIGAFEAGAAVAYTLDSMIGEDSEAAARVSDQAIHVIETCLEKSMFPDAMLDTDVDYSAIFDSKRMRREFEIQEICLNSLVGCETSKKRFQNTLERIIRDSKKNPDLCK